VFRNPSLGTRTIGLVGFEPTASWSRTRRSTKLSHSPNCWLIRYADAPRVLTSPVLRYLASSSQFASIAEGEFVNNDAPLVACGAISG
jgi:hypothetical protein